MTNKVNGQNNNCEGEESKTKHWCSEFLQSKWYNVEKCGIIHRQIPVFLLIQFQFTELSDYN